MVLSTERSLAIRCPECGRFELFTFSLFDFSGRSAVNFSCSCGASLVTVTTKDRRRFIMKAQCLVCETSHIISLGRREMFMDKVAGVYCPETGLELAYIGDAKLTRDILKTTREDVRSLVDDGELVDYFHDPDVMLGALKTLHRMASEGNLGCECGNRNISVDIFPGKIELRCPECGSLNVIHAETEDDLAALRAMEAIEMARGAAGRKDSPGTPGHTRTKH